MFSVSTVDEGVSAYAALVENPLYDYRGSPRPLGDLAAPAALRRVERWLSYAEWSGEDIQQLVTDLRANPTPRGLPWPA